VKAVLDFFGLREVTAIGMSLGGMLMPRAAAFDKRIRRVVGWSIFTNFLDVMLATRKKALRTALKAMMRLGAKGMINAAMRRQMATDPLAKWAVEHGMYVFGAASPYDYLRMADGFQIKDVAERIDQDFLLLAAKNDHYIPFALYKDEIDALGNARSLTFRVFTAKETADNHCNIGNTGLALDVIIRWIGGFKER
jgi:pimeloyl-ACP methyl ester carboxylesterase